MAEKQLAITAEYHPIPLRERVSRRIQTSDDDLLTSDLEIAYADSIDKLTSAQFQIAGLQQALKVATEVVRLVHNNNPNGRKHSWICYLLSDIQRTPQLPHTSTRNKVHEVMVALCPGEASERVKWDRVRHLVAPRIYRRDGYKCVYCQSRINLSVDHVMPVSRGGSHEDSNLVTCCGGCNSSKGDKTIAEWDAMKRGQ